MSTERLTILGTLKVAQPATQPDAQPIAASVGKQAAAHASVDIRYVGADDADARAIARSTETETYPYSSFEQGGVRRFERSPFARGRFEGGTGLPLFRVS